MADPTHRPPPADSRRPAPVDPTHRPSPARPHPPPARPLPIVDAPPSAPARPLRVVLVHLPTITAPQSLSYYGAIPPLGLAYVAAAARAAGHHVAVVDGTGEAIDDHRRMPTAIGDVLVQGLTPGAIAARVDPHADVIGVSLMFLHQWPLCREVLAALRRRSPRALLVAGGETPTAFWAEMLAESPDLDLCVLGEGESTFVALLAALAASAPPHDLAPSHASNSAPTPPHASVPSQASPTAPTRATAIPHLALPGLAFRTASGLPTRSDPAPRLGAPAVAGLPRPAWDLFPVDAYLARGHGSGVDRGRSIPVLTSRGCPYRCSFCSSPTMWTTRYVRRDPADVVDEIADLQARYRVTNVDLNDLTAMLTKEWMLELARAIRARGLRVTLQLPSGTRSEAVDAEAAAALHAAGVRNFCYAPESGSPATLARIHKKVDLDALRASLRAAVDAGLTTHASIIIGFPHETLADLARTFGLCLRLAVDGCHTIAVMVFQPYPGSEEYARLQGAGAIELGDPYYYGSLLRAAGGPRSYHPDLGPRALLGLQLGMLTAFFAAEYALRPRRLLTLARNLVHGRQESVLDLFLATKARQLRLLRRADAR